MTFKPSVDLEQLMGLLGQALPAYSRLVPGLEFGSFAPFALTPEKPNAARTLVPVTYQNVQVGNMFAIAFLPGDGTGDYNTYKPGQLKVPGRYAHEQKQERVFPRSKAGIHYELFLPFGSIYNGKVCNFAVSLEELTVEGTEKMRAITRLCDLGLVRGDYYSELIVPASSGVSPEIQLTTGYRPDGERFGDPHAIYSSIVLKAVQLVGFLPVTDMNSPVVELAKKVSAA